GTDKKNQPFTVTADYAIQLDNDHVQMVELTADIQLIGGKGAAITAKEGVLSTSTHQGGLKGDGDVFFYHGYEFTHDAMHIDIAKKTITSTSEVKGQGELGTLHAKGFVATQADGRIVFGGPVHMTLFMGK